VSTVKFFSFLDVLFGPLTVQVGFYKVTNAIIHKSRTKETSALRDPCNVSGIVPIITLVTVIRLSKFTIGHHLVGLRIHGEVSSLV